MRSRTDQSLALPPKVPDTLEALTRAITLLGAFAKDTLRQSKREELLLLLGRCPPNSATATAWKAMLKKLREDEIWRDS
jgi:hypothetical protein